MHQRSYPEDIIAEVQLQQQAFLLDVPDLQGAALVDGEQVRAERQENVDRTIVTLIRVLQFGSPAPCVNVVPAGCVNVKCIRGQAGDIVGVHARDAQQGEMFTSVSVELLAHARDNEMLLPPEDVPRDERYVIADISERSIPRKYSTLHHYVLRGKTTINSEEITTHNHASSSSSVLFGASDKLEIRLEEPK